jgi:D-alanyl-D-alanine carboxypeptidase/D-alanyl-D-alanine-endopeptidase (penicillin-binding protein 4)
VIVAVAAITLAFLGSMSHTSTHDVAAARTTHRSPRPARHARRAAHARHRHVDPNAIGGRAPRTPAVIALQAALDKTMRLAGASSGAFVYDLDADRELYGMRETVKRPPASVEKLWTTTALLLKLGPTARLHTTLLGTGHLSHGLWHGDLYLRGGGDPTFGDTHFNVTYEHGYGPTPNQLVDQLRKKGIRRVTGHIYGDGSMFDRRRGGMLTKQLVDVPDFGGQLSALTFDHGTTAPHYDPATFAARELALTMRAMHVDAKASTHGRTAPRGAHLLAIVSSPPLATMAQLMNVPSDDLFAEMFTKQLGVLFGSGGTIAAGADVIAHTVAEAYDLHPKIVDGSGLSRDDGSSPLEVVDLFRAINGSTLGGNLDATLPVVGESGTVESIALKTRAVGHCVAKTGTLNYVTNLAGTCDAKGGHRLAFAFFIDGPDNGTAILLEGKMIAAVARY